MFNHRSNPTLLAAAFSMLMLIYHATVRELRQTHGNAVIGLLLDMMQMIMLVAAFYVMFEVLGTRGSAIRGSFIMFLMTGIVLFLTHIKSMAAVMKADGPLAPMMQHTPMNTIVAIAASTLARLYIQLLSIILATLGAHVLIEPIDVHQPAETIGMVIIAWWSGVSVGLLAISIRPWAPGVVSLLSSLYMRANMIASGKMFTANSLPGYMIPYFAWNPLFHTIDQARGFAFINYFPHYTSVMYPIYVSIALTCLGLLGEFFGRKAISISWFAGK